jgi:hypothetical protein
MRQIPIILAILLAVDSLFVSFLNYSQPIKLIYNNSENIINSNLAIIISLAFFIGAITAFSISYYSLKNVKSKLIKTSQKSEKASITAEENSDKVKLLEEKIKTLEVALSSALSNKTSD